MISKGRFVVFKGNASVNTPAFECAHLGEGSLSLPTFYSTLSAKMKAKISHNNNIEARSENFDPSVCKVWYDGTLFIHGMTISHNNFHAINDNIMSLISQFVLDAYLFPSFVNKPRFGLDLLSRGNAFEVPHMRMMRDVFTRTFTLSQLDGACFSRIVWGEGIKLIYNHVLATLRRQTAQLVRLLAIKLYAPPNPFVAALSATNPAAFKKGRKFLEIYDPRIGTFRPLNIVLYTRGNSSLGRSIGNEDRLISQLSREGGANALICCEFSGRGTSFEDQLGFAVHADAVVGLHGAGLTNAVFSRKGVIMVELKGLYGYNLDLFAVVTDARQGIHCQVNILSYHKREGGHSPIDKRLADRVYKCLVDAVAIGNDDNENLGNGLGYDQSLANNQSVFDERPVKSSFAGGFRYGAQNGDSILGPINTTQSVLGPDEKDMKKECINLKPFASYWKSTRSNLNDYCKECSTTTK